MELPDVVVRTAAFRFLEEQTASHGEVIPREALANGFMLAGEQVRLIGPQGIFKPACLQVPISITTVPPTGGPPPYEDGFGSDGLMRYKYRGTDPGHRDNVGLREALQRHLPLVYNYGIVPNRYLPIWPVYVVDEDRLQHAFVVDVEDKRLELPGSEPIIDEIRRAYVARVTLHRLHQHDFRERVLQAYRNECAMCHLRHVELLEAAHILPDGHPNGEPIVPNGMALCRLHHGAFDRYVLGVRPDLTIEVRAEVLAEIDGPTLQYALKGMHGLKLRTPTRTELQPRKAFLEERYELFLKAG